MPPLAPRLQQLLKERHATDLYRRREVLDSPQGVEVVIEGRRFLNFCSNDYLGLANDPEVVAALQQAAARWGVGSGAAHLVSGHMAPHHALEEELAAFTGRERALLFSTGYMANLGVVSALLQRSDTVFEDRLNHASLIDAAILSRARLKRYAHGDVAQLARQLPAGQGERLVVTDGVFSMDGDIAPLPQLAAACQANAATLLVDDAHGLGVLGDGGGGSLEHFGLDGARVPILMGTLGKAFGTFGAFVAGEAQWIEALIQLARPWIFTTALPPAVAEATRVSLRRVQRDAWRRDKLRALVQRFRSGAQQLGFDLPDSQTPIQPLLLGEAGAALAASRLLRQRGMLVTAIRPPTVPAGTARLRITFCASHETGHVDRLLQALDEIRIELAGGTAP